MYSSLKTSVGTPLQACRSKESRGRVLARRRYPDSPNSRCNSMPRRVRVVSFVLVPASMAPCPSQINVEIERKEAASTLQRRSISRERDFCWREASNGSSPEQRLGLGSSAHSTVLNQINPKSTRGVGVGWPWHKTCFHSRLADHRHSVPGYGVLFNNGEIRVRRQE